VSVPSERPSSVTLLGALFFLSGATGLVYQVLWVHLLLPVFGTGVQAVSTVLATFMGGLALGAWAFGRIVDRRTAGGLGMYAALEAGIAVYALLLPLLLGRLDPLYTWLYGRLGGAHLGFAAMRFALAAAVLLVPTTLMGGTLPVLVRHVVRQGRSVGFSAGALYGLNTLGAVAGVAFAAFVAIERFGARRANALTAGANVAVALVAWSLARRESAPAETVDVRAESPEPANTYALWAYALCGFAALGLEVVWSRLLAVTLGITTTQSLSVVLLMYLTGLASGSAIGARRADRSRDAPGTFAVLGAALALAATLSIVAVGVAPRIAGALSDWSGWYGHMARLAVAAASVVLAPTLLMGLLFAVAAKLVAPGQAQVGGRIGRLYAANTGGAIAGALLSGFVLLPAIGAQRSLAALAWVYLVAGGTVWVAARSTVSRGKRIGAIVLGGAAVLLALALPSSFLVECLPLEPGAKLVYHAEGAAGTVTVSLQPDGTRLLRVNGAGEVPTDWDALRTFRLLGALPMALHPDPEEVLVIAYGGGIALATVESFGPRSLDCVEIVPGVVDASRQLADLNGRVFERVGGATIHMVYDDGRNHVLRTPKRYDVILSDSTHPGTADSWVLYTEEFYRQSRARLHPGGIFAQWLPIHGLTVLDYRSIARTFGRVFPHATLWYTRGYSILLATPEPLAADVEALGRRLAEEPRRTLLSEVDLSDPLAFLATLALDEAGFAAYAGTGPINTDDRPAVGFHDRARAGASGLLVVASLAPDFVNGVPAAFRAVDPSLREALGQRMLAVRLTLGAELAVARGDRAGAIAALRRALQLAPDDATARRALSMLESTED
jgi:spermidine synthase